MKELMRTNDPVAISYAEALLRDSGIVHMVLDRHMSVLEGSIGILPGRVMVVGERLHQARRLRAEAGLDAHLPGEGTK